MQCERCRKANLIEIKMTVGETELTFRRCGKCELQAWRGEDGEMPLSRVLELAHVRR